MSAKLRALILAEWANPESSSVALIGWSLAQALGRRVDVHLVTRAENAVPIGRAGWREGKDFTAIDTSRVNRPVARIEDAARKAGFGWTLSTALSAVPHAWFEHLTWRRFGDAIRRRDFDVVHRITPVSPTVPSSLAPRCKAAGTPFVLGPLNGGVPWPKEFRGALHTEGEWLSYLRGAHRLVPGYRATRLASSAILTGSEHLWGELRAHRERCVYMPENAIDPARVHAERGPREAGPLRVAFVGRLVAYKGADMLVEAAAPLIRSGRMTLDFIGDGPQMGSLRKQIHAEGIQGGVTMAGWIHDQRQVAPRLSRADVFGFPSVREFGGGAVLEAMALGLAPVIVDYAGPRELVTDRTGFRVPIGPRHSIVAGFRRILGELAAHPERAREVGERARARVLRHFTWDVKVAQILEVYEWVLGRRERPDFGMPFPDADEERGAASSVTRTA
ncbi:glycosyltransferase family 4 protein [Vulgatibacter incomptus]|uniref:Glycosyl transferase, group 1 family protein n=1 Tax=Vulgatibacter incomptus TaxID=1391653 RepID=A0A0K1P8J2_9BACT|nr:glycosyltransferase family 4 protein [Vulgatibacter incomptus]AKU89840.1 glycosyl transferase, group 1 family protein [Vulgatibacter incomptus]